MRRISTLTLLVLLVSTLGARAVDAQQPADILYNLYVQSILNPEYFDAYVESNVHLFDNSFYAHLNCVVLRLAQEANDDLNFCKQHADYQWQADCLKERPAADLLLWCLSLNATLSNDVPWEKTDKGALTIFAKRLLEQLGLDYQEMARWAINLMGPFLQNYFTCH